MCIGQALFLIVSHSFLLPVAVSVVASPHTAVTMLFPAVARTPLPVPVCLPSTLRIRQRRQALVIGKDDCLHGL